MNEWTNGWTKRMDQWTKRMDQTSGPMDPVKKGGSTAAWRMSGAAGANKKASTHHTFFIP